MRGFLVCSTCFLHPPISSYVIPSTDLLLIYLKRSYIVVGVRWAFKQAGLASWSVKGYTQANGCVHARSGKKKARAIVDLFRDWSAAARD